MKLKISELKPNPFKKQISNGKLNREQIDKIKANIKDLGFFGSLPVFKKENNYYLVAGHHRAKAIEETFGKDYQVEVVISNYNEDQVFRGMVIENITQRTNDFMELNQNVVAIENYLNSHRDVLEKTRKDRIEEKIKEGKISDRISNQYATQRDSRKVAETIIKKLPKESVSDDISFWVDKNSGEVLSHDVITQNLNIFHKLDPELRKDIEKKHNKENHGQGDENLNYTQAIILSGIDDKEEQKQLAKVLKQTREQRVREQGKLISQYKQAPEEIREQIKKGFVDLADIELATDEPSPKLIKIERTANDVVDDILSLLHNFKYNVDELLKSNVKEQINIEDISKAKANKAITTSGLHLKIFKNFVNALRQRGATPDKNILALIKVYGKI